VPISETMKNRFYWIDVLKPTKEEIAVLSDVNNIIYIYIYIYIYILFLLLLLLLLLLLFYISVAVIIVIIIIIIIFKIFINFIHSLGFWYSSINCRRYGI